MALNAYGYDDHSDLWGINPQTGRPYTVRERREAMAARGVDQRMLGGGQSTQAWDDWFDAVANASYQRTGKTQNRLNTEFEGGEPATGSNQLRGESLQSHPSLWAMQNADYLLSEPARLRKIGLARLDAEKKRKKQKGPLAGVMTAVEE